MNRETKREIRKKLKGKGYSKSEIDNFIKFKELYSQTKILKEGQRVKLNVDKIKNHPDWDKLTKKYRNWVELHKEDIFTVEYDKNHQDKPTLVCLQEDSSEPKWLFFVGDLIEI